MGSMQRWCRGVSALAAVVCFLAATPQSRAEIPDNKIKIGVLTDMSGMSMDLAGMGMVVATQLAIDDMAKDLPGVSVEVVSADTLTKADTGSAIVRRWMGQNVNVVVGGDNSAIALAVNELLRGTKVAFLVSDAGTSELTGAKCSPNTIQWTFDTWALANGTAKAVVKAGGDSWFFITSDFAFGHALEADASRVVKAMGGKVLGAVRHPLNSSDFSSFLLAAQASGAKIIGLANGGNDAPNVAKQAAEFGITKTQHLAAMLMTIAGIHSLGLPASKGMYLTEAYYWDLNDQTRAFAERFRAKTGKPPTMIQAGAYSATLHYLKVVKAINSVDGEAVIAKAKEMPTSDAVFGEGSVRQDGRHIHNMYLFQVKSPEESKGPWDYYKLVQTIPAAEAFRPLEESACPLVKK